MAGREVPVLVDEKQNVNIHEPDIEHTVGRYYTISCTVQYLSCVCRYTRSASLCVGGES